MSYALPSPRARRRRKFCGFRNFTLRAMPSQTLCFLYFQNPRGDGDDMTVKQETIARALMLIVIRFWSRFGMALFRKTAQVPAHTQVPVPRPTSLNVTHAATATRRQCAKRIAAFYTLKNLIHVFGFSLIFVNFATL